MKNQEIQNNNASELDIHRQNANDNSNKII